MQASWSLREEVSSLIERWYILVLAFLAGGVVGWGAAYIFPTDYEARANLSVAFNSDALFTSPDDYKNAQFEEVADLVLSDALLDEVLAKLQQEGDAWRDWKREDLRRRFTVQWRNAGAWQLVVRDRDEGRARQLAFFWQDAAIQLVTGAIAHAETFYQLDLALKAANYAQGENYREQTRLQAVEMAIHAWLSKPEDGPVSERERAELKTLVRAVSSFDSFDIPDEGDDRQAYVNRAAELLAALETGHALLETQDQALRARITSLNEDWLAEKTASRGLSAFLSVDIHQASLMVSEVRTPAVLTLVGGWIGVLGWLGFRLVQVARKIAARRIREEDGENG